MIWLTWRQFRVSALAVFGVLGAVGVVLAATGPGLHRDYADLVARCEHGCIGDVYDNFFFPRVGAYTGLALLVLAVPVIAGVFWGAPLVSREFETGTRELVWQQSVSRRRWLAVKVGLVGLAAAAAAALAVVPVSLWSAPLDATAITGLNRMTPIVYDARGVVVIGHSMFAFVLGVAAGLLLRRTVPAMAATLAIFAAVQIIVPTLIRPHFANPVSLEVVVTPRDVTGVDSSGGTIRGLIVNAGPPDAWLLTNETVDSTGRAVDTLPAWAADCAPPESPAQEVTQQRCVDQFAAAGYRQVVTYHPAHRFWPFQGLETAIFGLLSLLLAGFCLRRIRPH
ncbi:ABC-2 family transporter [Asanoa ferruginea]|uniref:ABC-2 family transporter n=1 Tax=Asanoa ferruginea TaxID=53367 RepID=A0A3D9ZM41_9ACTN|nr:ABC transporter permease subunit [Asanoa ferruginea]REF98355.1 ABC-2 family transporter [Asanoa ferruginea]GIF52795.1 transporter [Asanoa ferruginea]